jgi:hypothetical protein
VRSTIRRLLVLALAVALVALLVYARYVASGGRAEAVA